MTPDAAHPSRVLVIDDNPDVAGIVRLATRKLAHPVEVVAEVNAERALERLRYERFDLVISDYFMREMDGLRLYAQARPAEPDEKRVLFTAHGAKLDAQALADARLDGVIEKPMVLDALRTVIGAILARDAETMAALRRSVEARARG